MSDQKKQAQVVMLGLPKTGKTTFLAALWHVVESPEIKDAWKLVSLFEGDREYIEKRRQEWISFRNVKRTKVDGTSIMLSLRSPSGHEIRFEVPDLAGETFRQLFEEREMASDFAEMLRQATGALLFINPTLVKDPVQIDSVPSVLADERAVDAYEPEEEEPEEEEEVTDTTSPGEQPPDDEEEASVEVSASGTEDSLLNPAPSQAEADMSPPNDEANDTVGMASPVGSLEAGDATSDAHEENLEPFTLSRCCTVVKLVDLLQFVAAARSAPLRLAIMVSALDELDESGYRNAPAAFVRERLSLLKQFLDANGETFVTRIFGVSAQGVNYKNEQKVAEAQQTDDASDRVRLVASDGVVSKDLTLPLEWLCA